ncbi:hypothetical protein SAMN05421771_2486 [Granulicella pectinivorans]|uniref:Uncharacterized protein n=2 Tax=Granulicella pectinivorans TaxID=474950 RepID=A0A1I6MES9_9BACT|nr:hypothetical protein SAMN05421771_2486 [Granulicella pectinivorans]
MLLSSPGFLLLRAAGITLNNNMTRTLTALALITLSVAATAQGTKLWTTDRYETLERGTTSGVAIRNDGRLTPAPATTLAFTSSGNYIWSVAGDAKGNAYLGMGGTSSGGATVQRVAADGKATKIFEGKELGVQALRLAADGTVYVATNPDGKVYRVSPSGGPPIVVFDPASTAEHSKYLWDMAVSASGDLYVAAGAPAAVYRVTQNKPELLFKTTDQHIRSLLLAHDGQLWAGTDGGGVIYRFEPKTAGAKPFAMYAATEREITALTEDAAGNVYAAAVGSKSTSSLPPLPVTGAVGVTISFVQPGSAGAVVGSTVIPEGSVLYRIAADGAPSKLLSLKEDVVYGLAVKDGALIASTGNRGRVYAVDLGAPGRFSDIAHLEASQGTALATAPHGDLLLGTSNSGKLYRLGGVAKAPTYVSEVFDAGGLSRWGRPEVRTDTPYTLSLRVGNVPSPAEGWSDWIKLDAGAKVPNARFAQWRLELAPTTAVEAVAINYLPRNVAPVVDDIAVQTGARVTANPVATVTTVQIPFPAPPAATGFTVPMTDTSPLTGQKDRSAITVRWAAHDDNGDDLMFAVWFRGVGENNFHLLKENLSDRFYSFDAATLPDGPYVLKVIASDGPSHPDPETLTAERVSGPFVVDTTAPVVSGLKATRAAKTIAASCEATDATSPIAHAEYSLDAGPWQYLEPTGTLSDAKHEAYEFSIPLTDKSTSSEHVLAVRVYDRYENIGTAKVIVR